MGYKIIYPPGKPRIGAGRLLLYQMLVAVVLLGALLALRVYNSSLTAVVVNWLQPTGKEYASAVALMNAIANGGA